MLNTISQRLSQMKAESGLSTRKLAELSGVPEGTISKILSGQTQSPSFEAVNSLTAAMGYSIENILADIPKEKKIGVTDHYQHIINAYKEQIEMHKEQLCSHRRAIKILYFSLAAFVACVMFLLIFDLLNPNIGYILY